MNEGQHGPLYVFFYMCQSLCCTEQMWRQPCFVINERRIPGMVNFHKVTLVQPGPMHSMHIPYRADNPEAWNH